MEGVDGTGDKTGRWIEGKEGRKEEEKRRKEKNDNME